MTITDRRGRTFVERRAVPRGDVADPLSREAIRAKFRLAARGRLSAADTAGLIQMLEQLERLPDTRELTSALRAPAYSSIAPPTARR